MGIRCAQGKFNTHLLTHLWLLMSLMAQSVISRGEKLHTCSPLTLFSLREFSEFNSIKIFCVHVNDESDLHIIHAVCQHFLKVFSCSWTSARIEHSACQQLPQTRRTKRLYIWMGKRRHYMGIWHWPWNTISPDMLKLTIGDWFGRAVSRHAKIPLKRYGLYRTFHSFLHFFIHSFICS